MISAALFSRHSARCGKTIFVIKISCFLHDPQAVHSPSHGPNNDRPWRVFHTLWICMNNLKSLINQASRRGLQVPPEYGRIGFQSLPAPLGETRKGDPAPTRKGRKASWCLRTPMDAYRTNVRSVAGLAVSDDDEMSADPCGPCRALPNRVRQPRNSIPSETSGPEAGPPSRGMTQRCCKFSVLSLCPGFCFSRR